MDFETFINKYSFVNSKFVKDFYNIIKEDYIERYNEFLIDSEILRKWLQINIKRSFNDTIKKSYKKNIDYKIEKVKKSEGSGGHNFEIITLTPEASKKICLSTNSKMGGQVQQYFLDLEVALYKYKNFIIEGMNKKIQQLENNQKFKINPSKKIIYVFKALNTDLTDEKWIFFRSIFVSSKLEIFFDFNENVGDSSPFAFFSSKHWSRRDSALFDVFLILHNTYNEFKYMFAVSCRKLV
jgi:hypothetical protein